MTADAVENPVPQPLPEAAAAHAGDHSSRTQLPDTAAEHQSGEVVSLPPLALERAVDEHGASAAARERFWDAVRTAPTDAAALRLLFGHLSVGPGREGVDRVARLLNRNIALIDVALSEQVNVILHHPRFQQLEASWRGLKHLVEQAADAQEVAARRGEVPEIKIRVISMSKRELWKDVDGAGEFDQSQIFRKVYDEEFGMPGGTPYGALLGDYEFTNHPNDVELLAKMSEVAAASFAPFLTSPAPALLGIESFADLQQPVNLASTFQQASYLKWNALRDREDSRFLGLLLPRVLMRLPYENDGSENCGFCFAEDTSGQDFERYLWGSSIYAFGSVLTRAFADCGWFADIRGAERGLAAGGLATGLPVHCFKTDARHVAAKMSTDVALQEDRDAELGDLGFVTLCHCQDTEYLAYFANQSVQRAKKYDDPAATTNAKVSAMLQYILCCSRFAHYLKVYVRDKVGTVRSAAEIESELHNWLVKYVTVDDQASPDVKARFPLREGRVTVHEQPGKPGAYSLVMHLLPHFQLDQLTVALKMVTRLTSPAST